MADLEALLETAGIAVLETGQWLEINGQPIPYYGVKGADCIRAWQILSQQSDRTVIVLPPHLEMEETPNPAAIAQDLASYATLDLDRWMVECWGDYDFQNEEDELADILDARMDEMAGELENELGEAAEGGWAKLGGEVGAPAGSARSSPLFTLPYDVLTRQPLDQMWLVDFAQIPHHEVPIYLQYGGWNACPEPTVHAAILKRWRDRHGAVLFGLSDAVLELYVQHPLTTEEAAWVIAKEQMAYCDDIVFQGTMTVERLAKGLVNNPTWYFWWD